jgi:hypothetical protein
MWKNRKWPRGRDPLANNPKAAAIRNAICNHNGCLGGVRFALQWAIRIQHISSASPEAKHLAGRIERDLQKLDQELRDNRIDYWEQQFHVDFQRGCKSKATKASTS